MKVAFLLSILFASSCRMFGAELIEPFDILFFRRAISVQANHIIREEFTIHLRNAAAKNQNSYIQHFDFMLHKDKVSKLNYMTGYSEIPDAEDPKKEPQYQVLKRMEVPTAIYSSLSANGIK
jgi:hypothetical protein